MALSRIMNNSLNFCKSIKPIYSNFLSLSYLSTHHSDLACIANDFISIFTRQPFCPDNPVLLSLAPLLNTKVVESVLKNFRSWRYAYTFFSWAGNQPGYNHNIYTYNAMASILSHARQNAALRDLSVEILNSRCLMSPGSLGFLIRCLGNAGLANEANLLFDEVKMKGLCVPNLYTYNCLLETISGSSATSVDLIEMRLQEMRDQAFEFDKYTLTPLLQFYCNVGKFKEALDVFNEINNRGWADDYVFCILVLSFSKWGQVDRAFELIEKMEDRNIRLNEKMFYNLIHGFVKLSRVDKALLLFDKMKRYGFAPDISVFSVLIGGFCANKELEKALSLCAEMKVFKIKPDVGIVAQLLSSFTEEGEITRMLEEIHWDGDIKGLTLLCNSVLNSLVNNGLIDKAHCLLQAMMGNKYDHIVDLCELFRRLERVPPDTTSFTTVINSLVKVCKLDLALSLFQDMAKIGCDRTLVLYNNLIDGLCNSDRLEESFELLREMEDSSFRPTAFTHNSIFGCLCRRGDVAGAIDMVKKMRGHGQEPWVKHYTLLVRNMCENGKAIGASAFLAQMTREGFVPNIIAYSALMNGLVKIQELDQALKLFHDICARGHCPDVIAYNILIKGFCRAQRIAEAQNIFIEMEKKGVVPSVVTFNLLIDGWCRSGHVDEALLSLSTMKAKEKDPNVITYTSLIDGLCKDGRPDDALVLWNEMRRKECSPNEIAFMALIQGLCKCGRPNEALVYFREMEERKMESSTCIYIALVSAFLNNLNFPLAFEILKEMIDKGKLPDMLDKSYVTVRDAIIKLSGDERTSSSVKSLLDSSSIPALFLSDIAAKDGDGEDQ